MPPEGFKNIYRAAKAAGMKLKAHPLRILMDNGVKVTVNTDDVMIFGQKSSDEFINMYKDGLYSAEELNQVRLNGFPL